MTETKREELLALAERCEAGQDDEYYLVGKAGKAIYGNTRMHWPGRQFYRFNDLLAASAFLDAAMMLADGFVLLHLSNNGADGLPFAVLGDPGTTPVSVWRGFARTLPFALCAAALRARASVGERG